MQMGKGPEKIHFKMAKGWGEDLLQDGKGPGGRYTWRWQRAGGGVGGVEISLKMEKDWGKIQFKTAKGWEENLLGEGKGPLHDLAGDGKELMGE